MRGRTVYHPKLKWMSNITQSRGKHSTRRYINRIPKPLRKFLRISKVPGMIERKRILWNNRGVLGICKKMLIGWKTLNYISNDPWRSISSPEEKKLMQKLTKSLRTIRRLRRVRSPLS